MVFARRLRLLHARSHCSVMNMIMADWLQISVCKNKCMLLCALASLNECESASTRHETSHIDRPLRLAARGSRTPTPCSVASASSAVRILSSGAKNALGHTRTNHETNTNLHARVVERGSLMLAHRPSLSTFQHPGPAIVAKGKYLPLMWHWLQPRTPPTRGAHGPARHAVHLLVQTSNTSST